MYGLKVKNVDGQPHLYLDSSISAPGSSVDEMLRAWMKQADKLKNLTDIQFFTSENQ